MKKVLSVLVTALVISVLLVVSLGVTAFADEVETGSDYGYQEPAPESGDGISNGSGFDDEAEYPDKPGSPDSQGPAPNSGDGVPDGSGF